MMLRDAQTLADIQSIYTSEGLVSVADKIRYLKKTMKILASTGDIESPEEELSGLEDLALSHLWAVSE